MGPARSPLAGPFSFFAGRHQGCLSRLSSRNGCAQMLGCRSEFAAAGASVTPMPVVEGGESVRGTRPIGRSVRHGRPAVAGAPHERVPNRAHVQGVRRQPRPPHHGRIAQALLRALRRRRRRDHRCAGRGREVTRLRHRPLPRSAAGPAGDRDAHRQEDQWSRDPDQRSRQEGQAAEARGPWRSAWPARSTKLAARSTCVPAPRSQRSRRPRSRRPASGRIPCFRPAGAGPAVWRRSCGRSRWRRRAWGNQEPPSHARSHPAPRWRGELAAFVPSTRRRKSPADRSRKSAPRKRRTPSGWRWSVVSPVGCSGPSAWCPPSARHRWRRSAADDASACGTRCRRGCLAAHTSGRRWPAEGARDQEKARRPVIPSASGFSAGAVGMAVSWYRAG